MNLNASTYLLSSINWILDGGKLKSLHHLLQQSLKWAKRAWAVSVYAGETYNGVCACGGLEKSLCNNFSIFPTASPRGAFTLFRSIALPRILPTLLIYDIYTYNNRSVFCVWVTVSVWECECLPCACAPEATLHVDPWWKSRNIATACEI